MPATPLRSATRAALLCGLALVVSGCSREPAASPATRDLPDNRPPTAEAAPAEPRSPGRRIALVLGNSAYESAPLVNPANDAALVADTLTRLGFEVRLRKDGDQKAMKRAIQEFGATLEQGGVDTVGLFYYAGHGVQLGGRNYLIPVGARIERDADVEIEAVSADWVLEQMRHARNRLNFVILDACRNNPFARSFRSAATGLAKMDAPAGVLIAYSTAPGDVAADGAGGNSPYTEALARAMQASDEPAELMFKQVRNEVRRATGERQTPWESSSLTGQNFYFARAPARVGAAGGADGGNTAGAGAGSSAGTGMDTSTSTATGTATGTSAGEGSGEATTARQPSSSASDATGVAQPPSETPGTAAAQPAVDEPVFMEYPNCRIAAGRWRVEGEGITGFVTLDARAGGVAKLREAAQAGALTWDCDPTRGELFVKYRGGAVHKLGAVGDEKLLFGYDQDGQPVVYTR